jgi:hypothetical protein
MAKLQPIRKTTNLKIQISNKFQKMKNNKITKRFEILENFDIAIYLLFGTCCLLFKIF